MTHKHQVKAFKLSHLTGLPGAYGWLRPDIHQAYENSPSWSAFCDYRFIGALGIMIPYKGFGEAWCMVSLPAVQAPRHTLWFYRTVKERILGTARDLGLHRLQATVDTTNPLHLRFVEALGFAPEATLRMAGPQRQDFQIWALYPEEQ